MSCACKLLTFVYNEIKLCHNYCSQTSLYVVTNGLTCMVYTKLLAQLNSYQHIEQTGMLIPTFQERFLWLVSYIQAVLTGAHPVELHNTFALLQIMCPLYNVILSII